MHVFVQPIDKVGGKDDNEGDGFRNQENQFEFYSATAKLLASHLPRADSERTDATASARAEWIRA